MTVVKGHFDGKVLVLDEPADLPLNRPLEIQVKEIGPGDHPLLGLVRAAKETPMGAGAPKDLAAQHEHYSYGTPKKP